ncbi:MAG TPA: HTH-type transcriptional regulator ArgP [Herbaspirillum sp.]|jgi:LysR family transcriptional regulator (chromosome initiation inhibitor)|nr:HTH-type transcriptional regulator ArgP [Herbaspirillum sp.]
MDINAKQATALLAVLDTGSFEKAAARLHLTASAVSQRIRTLESQFGGPLVIRNRPCLPTTTGMRLLQYLRRASQLEADFVADLAGPEDALWTAVVAVNADTLSTWFFPELVEVLLKENVLLDLTVDDQAHTHRSLETGRTIGCISSEPRAMRGCSAALMGVMRYRLMASLAFKARWFPQGMTRQAAAQAPVIAHTRKDDLQSRFLKLQFGLLPDGFPRHYVPIPGPRLQAIEQGLGYGMVPELQLEKIFTQTELIDLAPQHPTDVALYWHSWDVQSPRMASLCKRIVETGRKSLRAL